MRSWRRPIRCTACPWRWAASTVCLALAWLTAHYAPGRRLVYLMSDGAALPLGFSQTVTALKQEGLLAATITFGHAFGGDLEAVNIYSALLAAKHVVQADLAVVLMGPGVVGTGTTLGHNCHGTGHFPQRGAAAAGDPRGHTPPKRKRI